MKDDRKFILHLMNEFESIVGGWRDGDSYIILYETQDEIIEKEFIVHGDCAHHNLSNIAAWAILTFGQSNE